MNPANEFEKYAVKHRGISSNTLNDYHKYAVTNLTPNIIEERPMNVAVMDVYSRLMMDRIVPGGVTIDLDAAGVATLRALVVDLGAKFRPLVKLYDNTASLQGW